MLIDVVLLHFTVQQSTKYVNIGEYIHVHARVENFTFHVATHCATLISMSPFRMSQRVATLENLTRGNVQRVVTRVVNS